MPFGPGELTNKQIRKLNNVHICLYFSFPNCIESPHQNHLHRQRWLEQLCKRVQKHFYMAKKKNHQNSKQQIRVAFYGTLVTFWYSVIAFIFEGTKFITLVISVKFMSINIHITVDFHYRTWVFPGNLNLCELNRFVKFANINMLQRLQYRYFFWNVNVNIKYAKNITEHRHVLFSEMSPCEHNYAMNRTVYIHFPKCLHMNIIMPWTFQYRSFFWNASM